MHHAGLARSERPTRGSLTALASLARTALDAAREAGIDADELLHAAGIGRPSVEDVDGRVEVTALFRLWELAAEASMDPFFGLHVGEHVASSKTFHVACYAARRSDTLGEGFLRTVRFGRLTHEGTELSLHLDGATAVFSVGPRPGTPRWPRCYAEMSLATHWLLGRRWTAAPFDLVTVRFQHAAPRDRSEYRRIFGCEPEFGAAENQLLVDASVTALPMRDADPDIVAYLDTCAAELLARAQSHHATERLARAQILKEITPGPPRLPNVARRIGMSARSLQRRLAEEGQSFAALVDDVRREEALALMRKPLSISEIAALVGYRDDDSFRAAFVRWAGKTPREYRKRGG
jgi:AraC-like DNA-binding protein